MFSRHQMEWWSLVYRQWLHYHYTYMLECSQDTEWNGDLLFTASECITTTLICLNVLKTPSGVWIFSLSPVKSLPLPLIGLFAVSFLVHWHSFVCFVFSRSSRLKWIWKWSGMVIKQCKLKWEICHISMIPADFVEFSVTIKTMISHWDLLVAALKDR